MGVLLLIIGLSTILTLGLILVTKQSTKDAGEYAIIETTANPPKIILTSLSAQSSVHVLAQLEKESPDKAFSIINTKDISKWMGKGIKNI